MDRYGLFQLDLEWELDMFLIDLLAIQMKLD